MALYRLLVRINMNLGALQDVATWTHGCDLTSLPSPAQLAALWDAAMVSTVAGSSLRLQTPGYAQRMSVELAPAAGGDAVVFAPLSGQLGIGSSTMPSQSAMPLIAMVSGPRGPRAGARWMLGPMANSAQNGRPSSQQQSAPLSYGKALHAGLGAYGAGLVVLRDGGTTADPVTAFSTGNAFGSVGRRRLEVTARTVVAA